MNWQPSADLTMLRARAALLDSVREFFAARHMLEVETPLLCSAGVTDPAIEPLIVERGSSLHSPHYLQTSPEYAMKRLLAADSGPIYQLTKAFRDGEAGVRHNPEFTLLEWYRPDHDYHQLMRAWELKHRTLTSQCVAEHTLFREETRWPGYYYRGDHLKLDDENWHCLTVSRRDPKTGKFTMEKVPVYHIVDDKKDKKAS